MRSSDRVIRSHYRRLTDDDGQWPEHVRRTQVFGQRDILLLLNDESRRARRYGTPLALALLSIDEFSTFSVSHGPAAAEHLLIRLCQPRRTVCASFHLVGRDGAKSSADSPNVRVSDAMVGFERLRERLEAAYWENHRNRG